MASAAPAHNGEAQLNGLIQDDQQKQAVTVHTFDPNATPEQKGAAAGKGRSQIAAGKDSDDAGGKGEFDLYFVIKAKDANEGYLRSSNTSDHLFFSTKSQP